MRKTLILLALLISFTLHAEQLPSGKSQIIMYSNFNGEETIYKRPTSNPESYIYVDNQKSIIAIYIDGFVFDILKFDTSLMTDKDQLTIFKAESGMDGIEKNCMINTIDSQVGQIQELWIERSNGTHDIFAISPTD